MLAVKFWYNIISIQARSQLPEINLYTNLIHLTFIYVTLATYSLMFIMIDSKNLGVGNTGPEECLHNWSGQT